MEIKSVTFYVRDSATNAILKSETLTLKALGIDLRRPEHRQHRVELLDRAFEAWRQRQLTGGWELNGKHSGQKLLDIRGIDKGLLQRCLLGRMTTPPDQTMYPGPDLQGDVLEVGSYDAAHGEGAAQAAVTEARELTRKGAHS